MTDNPDPKDMLHVISELSALLGRAQYALEQNDKLLKRVREHGHSYPFPALHGEAHEATKEALGRIRAYFNHPDEAPDAG